MFCPECGCEYREGFTECADCHVALVNEPPELKKAAEEEPLEVCWETDDQVAAEAACAALREHGIKCGVVERGRPDYTAALMDHAYSATQYVLVRQSEVSRARDIIEDMLKQARANELFGSEDEP